MSDLPPRPGADDSIRTLRDLLVPDDVAATADPVATADAPTAPTAPIAPALPPPPALPGWNENGWAWGGGTKLPSSPAYSFASYSQRVGAWVIDGLLIALATIPAWVVLFASPWESFSCGPTSGEPSTIVIEECSEPSVGAVLLWLGLLAFVAVGAVAYRVLAEGGSRGQTIGKRAVGIRVVHESGEPLGYSRALGRTLLQMAAWSISCAGFVDYLWPLWDPRRQALHDKVVDSVVIEA